MLKNSEMHTLIVAPTRELAEQIRYELRSFSRGLKIYDALLIGGVPITRQINDLKRRPRIVIGTPGRIKDHLNRHTLKLNRTTSVVLDEVDRMLDMGFVQDVSEILATLPSQRQSQFFSATIDSRVGSLINTFTKNPVTVTIKSRDTSENVHQDVVHYHPGSDKKERLFDILRDPVVVKAIVFNETQRDVERLNLDLSEAGFSADSIHGGKSQGKRKRALARFKNNEIRILVATDVAARGIDVSDISHVINYSIPNEYQDYIHRIGRAGRAGRIGYALTFVKHRAQ